MWWAAPSTIVQISMMLRKINAWLATSKAISFCINVERDPFRYITKWTQTFDATTRARAPVRTSRLSSQIPQMFLRCICFFFTVSITQLEKTRLSMELCQNAPSFAGESTQPNLCLFPLTLHMFSTKKGKLSWPASWLPRSQRERPQAQGGRVGTWLHESSLIAGVFLPAVRMSTWGNFVDLYFLLKRNNQLLKGIMSKIF